MPPPEPPSVNDGRRIAGTRSRRARRAPPRPTHEPRPRAGEPDPRHRLLEQLAVLGHLDRAHARAEQLHAVPVEQARLVRRHREVQARLAAERGQDRRHLLPCEHLVEDLDGERLDVRRVGQLRVRHDRRRVRVDQHDAQALLAERLARLGPRVVELAGLADHDRPRPMIRTDSRSLRRGIARTFTASSRRKEAAARPGPSRSLAARARSRRCRGRAGATARGGREIADTRCAPRPGEADGCRAPRPPNHHRRLARALTGTCRPQPANPSHGRDSGPSASLAPRHPPR